MNNIIEESIKVVDSVFELLLLTDEKGIKGNAENAFEILRQIKTNLAFHNTEERKEYKKKQHLIQIVDLLIGIIRNEDEDIERKKYVLNIYKVFCMNMFHI